MCSNPCCPPIDAQFAKSLGIADGNLEQMRSEIRTNLEREVTSRLRARTKDSVMAGLLTVASFEVPKSLVEGEKQRLAEAARNDLVARGVSAAGGAAPAGPVPAAGRAPRAARAPAG